MNLETSMPKGLSDIELQQNIEKYGLNKLPKKEKKTLLQIYIDQHKNPIIYILIFATIAAFGIKEFSDGFLYLAF